MANLSRVLSAVCAAVLLLAVDAHPHTVITRMSDRQNVTLAQLAAAAAMVDVVLIGESHDEQYHHDLQLDLIRSLIAGKTPVAIGMEMIQSDYQEQLDQWVAGKLAEPMMQAVFELNWSDWKLYRDIFILARDKKIPMVALNIPIRIVRKVSQQGFGSLTAEERGTLPAGTSCDLKNPQIVFLKRIFNTVANHGMNGKMFNNFCEAQTVRNSGMALNISRYLERQPGRKMVVLTGIWHAVKYGIPDQLQRLGSKVTHTVILPETPQINGGNAGAGEADYLVEL